MASKRTVQNWDAQTHEDILMAVIDHVKPSHNDWADIMAKLGGNGYAFTESALKYVHSYTLPTCLSIYLSPSALYSGAYLLETTQTFSFLPHRTPFPILFAHPHKFEIRVNLPL